MNAQSFTLAERLIPSTYIQQAVSAKKWRENLIKTFIEQRKWPEEGWDDATIELFLNDLAHMDCNNFPENSGVGEREARFASGLVARRHYRLGHGIGRSGDIGEVQPKAAGSSLMTKLANALLLDTIRFMGVKNSAGCFLVPMATGMSLVLCMLTIKQDRPGAKFVLWSRIDQKSCFKSILTAGLQPIIVEPILSGDELRTDVHGMETQITTLGSNNIVCVLSTTSCFAPRASDSLEHIATLCSRHNIPHLVNNAYGLQSARLMHLIQEAAKQASKRKMSPKDPYEKNHISYIPEIKNSFDYCMLASGLSVHCEGVLQLKQQIMAYIAKIKGRVDAFVQSTDKNLLVPVGGAIISGFDKGLLERISRNYPGRASSSPVIDVFMTLLSLGSNGYKNLIYERKEMFKYLKEELGKIAAKHGERILDTRNNPISMAMTLSSLNSAGDCKRITLLGSMLFLRDVTGTRCITGIEHKDVASYQFEGWGAHHSNAPCPYITAAAGIGMKKSDVDLFVHRLDKVLAKLKIRSGPLTPTSVEELGSSGRRSTGRVVNGESSEQGSSAGTSLASSKDSLRK